MVRTQENNNDGDRQVLILGPRQLATVFKIAGFSHAYTVTSKEQVETHLDGADDDTIIITTRRWVNAVARLSDHRYIVTLPERFSSFDDITDIKRLKADVLGMDS